MNNVPDWKLPAGTSRGLWDYLHDSTLARTYDERLSSTPLLELDERFAASFFLAQGSLIDLGCGTGRILFPFALRGFNVLGVDLSPEMLRVAAAKAAAAGATVALIQANLVELEGVRDEAFDCATCLFSTLGMISGADNRRRALAHAYRVLRPGGRFVLHVHNLWYHLGTRGGRRWLLRDRWRRWRGAADYGDYEMPAHEGIAGLALHHYSRREIVRELCEVGFKISTLMPVSPRADGHLRGWLSGLRAYGYLIGAMR